jgi:hypothetical protein
MANLDASSCPYFVLPKIAKKSKSPPSTTTNYTLLTNAPKSTNIKVLGHPTHPTHPLLTKWTATLSEKPDMWPRHSLVMVVEPVELDRRSVQPGCAVCVLHHSQACTMHPSPSTNGAKATRGVISLDHPTHSVPTERVGEVEPDERSQKSHTVGVLHHTQAHVMHMSPSTNISKATWEVTLSDCPMHLALPPSKTQTAP